MAARGRSRADEGQSFSGATGLLISLRSDFPFRSSFSLDLKLLEIASFFLDNGFKSDAVLNRSSCFF